MKSLLTIIFAISLTSCALANKNQVVESPVPNKCYLQPITIYKRCSSGGYFVGIESYSQPKAHYVCCFLNPKD